jgi:hypothetical protein
MVMPTVWEQLKLCVIWKLDAVGQLVEAVRYKPEGRVSIPDGVIEIFL